MKGNADMIEVVVAGGIRIYTEGLTQALDADQRITVTATVDDPDELLSTLSGRRPDVVLIDLAGLDDSPELRQVVTAAAPVPFVAMAVGRDDAAMIRWAEAGVAGLVTRSASLSELRDFVIAAAGGSPRCSPEVQGALLRHAAAVASHRPAAEPPPPSLTPREREIAGLLVLGLTNREIAAQLFVEISTVKNHVHNLLRKLDASSRDDAVARMRRGTRMWDVAVRASAARETLTAVAAL